MPTRPNVHKSSSGRKERDAAYERFRQADPGLRLAAKLVRSARWKRVRKRYLCRHPLCCDPFGVHAKDRITVPALHVHHVQPLRSRPDLAFTFSNLRAVCTRCHCKIGAIERDGKDATQLFPPEPEDPQQYCFH